MTPSMSFNVESAIHMIAKRQPLASDLREIVRAFRISIDLEPIGDFAKNIGKRVGALRVGFETHAALAMRYGSSMMDAA